MLTRSEKIYLLAGCCLAAGASAFALAVRPPQNYEQFSVLSAPGPAEPSPLVFQKVPRLIHARHKVGKSENIRSISALYATDTRSLQSTNNNEFIFISRGGYMRVHNGRGLLYEVMGPGETLNGLVSRFRPKAVETRIFKEMVVRDNSLPPSSMLGNYKFSKGDRIILSGIYLSLDTYRLPFNDSRVRISSSFGYRYHPVLHRRIFHNGCDIPMPPGTPVYPSRSGKVIFAGWKGGYGNIVEVRHNDGSEARYGHLREVEVAPGETVQKSRTLLGKVGSTGVSTGPHLHFEIITPSGRSINPLSKIGRR